MRDHSFTLEPALFAPLAPLRCEVPTAPPWRWAVRDAAGSLLATAKTRAGARAAARALYNRGQSDGRA